MTKETGFVALLLAALGLTFAGCGEVKKCKRGEVGCVGGAVDSEGKCEAGLVARAGRCVDPDEVERDGGGGGDCNCGADEVCDEGGNCINFCAAVTPLVEVIPPAPCREPSGTPGTPGALFSFDKACEATCLQRCRRAEVLCPGYKCDPSTCTGPGVQALCRTECPGGDAECITGVCEGVRDRACADFECPATYQRDCNNIRCSNNCTINGTDNTRDGYCDDGDPLSADYDLCSFGNDCSDCGPRRGSMTPQVPVGGSCVRDVGCQGYELDFIDTAAWCVSVPGAPAGQFSCVPNCTDENVECLEGYECRGLQFMDGRPFTDPDGRQAYACMPIVCE